MSAAPISNPSLLSETGLGNGVSFEAAASSIGLEVAAPNPANSTASGFRFDVETITGSGVSLSAAEIQTVTNIAEAALARWADFIDADPDAIISVQLTIEPPEDGDDTTVASASAETNFVVGNAPDGRGLLLEANTITELRTGDDPNGSDPDLLITLNADFLTNGDLFLDETIEDGDVIPADQIDLYSLLLHEIGHGLGFSAFRDVFTPELPTLEFSDGTMERAGNLFDVLTELDSSGNVVFAGENVVAAYGEAVILETNVGPGSDLSHFSGAEGLDTFFALLNPFVLRGDRVDIGSLELALLADIGVPVIIPDDLPLVNIIESAGPSPTAVLGGFVGATGSGYSLSVGLDDVPNFSFAASSFGLEITGNGGSASQRFLFNGDEVSDTALVDLSDLLTSAQQTSFVGRSQESVDLRFFNPAQANLQNGTNEFTTSLAFELIGDGAGGTELSGGTGADIILARGGNDTLDGGAGADVLEGGNGNDTLIDGGGNDFANGGAGNDTFIVGVGVNALDGGDGVDTADYSAFFGAINVNLANNTTTGGAAGNDTLISIENITGTNGSDTLIGNDEDNILNGGRGNDTVSGGAGNDTFVIGTGINSTDGGSGLDTVDYSQFFGAITFDLVNQTVSGGAAVNDTISSIENAIGTNGNDVFIDGTSTNTLSGGAGNDTFIANTGVNVFNGGSGSDTIDYSMFNTAITFDLAAQDLSGGAAVNDDISSIENAIGTNGNDIFFDGASTNTLSGGAGNDTFIANTGVNVFNGGSGSDTVDFSFFLTGITFDLVNQDLSGGAAVNDDISSIENAIGTRGNDVFIDGASTNTLSGGAGNDTFIANTGVNVFNGGSGLDTIDYSMFNGAITFDLVNQDLSGGAAVNDDISSIENAIGTNGNDVFIDGASTNTLSGGAGNDTFVANTGVNVFNGGSGSDTIDYSMFNTAITFDLAAQDLSGGAAVNDDISSIENAIGTNGNDVFIDGASTNTLSGGAGNDTFIANTGVNVFNGGSGSDTIDYSMFNGAITFDLAAQDLSGGAAVNDDISSIENAIGTNGADTFISSAADNIFTGGTGADSFEFAAASSGNDTITDFSSAQGDTISLAGVASFADLDITQVGADAVIDLGSGDTLTLEGTNAADLTASDFGFGGSGSAILDRDGSATAEQSNVSSASGDESEDTFVFVTSASLPPVSFEPDSFDLDQEMPASDVNLQQDGVDLLTLDLGIELDATGQIIFDDAYLI